jgi:hypothetical protein
MIKLIGSEKQIEWASNIINGALETIEANKVQVQSNYPEGKMKERELGKWAVVETQYNTALAKVEQKPKNAAFVIENREVFGASGIIYAFKQI